MASPSQASGDGIIRTGLRCVRFYQWGDLFNQFVLAKADKVSFAPFSGIYLFTFIYRNLLHGRVCRRRFPGSWNCPTDS